MERSVSRLSLASLAAELRLSILSAVVVILIIIEVIVGGPA
jgi:hypothetical protein